KIHTENVHEELALKVLPLATAYQVYVNEKLIVSNGNVGKNSIEHEAYGKPHDAIFVPPGKTFDLIVHISNFDYAKGGMNRPLYLGTPEGLDAYNQGLVTKDFFLLGSLMIA